MRLSDIKKSVVAFFKTSLFVFCFTTSSFIFSQEVTTYYLIRHAEKETADPNNRNPHLTTIGMQRAHEWKTILKAVPFDKIYSTSYFRTQETAAPIAVERKLPIEAYDPRKLYTDSFKKRNLGKTILVVGHSNTTPVLANKILGKETYPQIDDSIHGNLYLLQVIDGKVTHQLLNIE